ncbi:tRNA (uracil-5-)-methyltransferase Gid [Spiroplasma culicicola AES-1]|uniref:Methylenetetrahydrofolate--tRNA-(uracil-5-)-methyltransferase TrmFO n=2 Tax=Spiroplasma culicicola TaxID=216935 RepID=W6A842_9MOLU|nr:methylenetetrahydrofolate--tRNA-(uracil(54)-C(5))-methyltransferase (FADH(2)-oxidizing) TrmFO [Spiroplasma culicicola]AHI53157.1 tRNA (uracil-5-)-methyltransferase Gid [Spiroplasma culicicola AES-1]
MEVTIVGAGLAGCELAYQLAEIGFKVKLYEKKNVNKNEIQSLNTFAELVCSNTFRSKSTQNAVGILKEELRLLNSFILDCAYKTAIPADDALAVDRVLFSQLVDKTIREHKNIEVVEEELKYIDEKKLTVITCGPLVSEEFKTEINRVIGNQKLFYLDASAPILTKESIDFNQVYFKSRHGDDNSYICIPLNQEEFEEFHNKLITGSTVKLKEFEKEIFFKGCQPIEQIAVMGKKALLNGPLSPNNLENNNQKSYAVIQLRRDDALEQLYNMVGFQTNLTWTEQKRIFSSLKGLQNAHFVRYGVMHKNNFINSPKILNKKLQVMRKKNIYFAGQITGVEGYIESFASSFIVFFALKALKENRKFIPFPKETILGSLINYITNEKIKKLKPMKANMGIIEVHNDKFQNKMQKNEYIFKQSLENIKVYLKKIN